MKKTSCWSCIKQWVHLFCNTTVETVWFGIAVIATFVTLGACWQILCQIFLKYFKVF